jgi:tRNA U34 5-carboxymethylaminomethyl modifying GTPase MnmE/TrmE
MALLDFYAALGELNSLTGEVVTEDILGRIFSRFCVGK